MMEDKNVTLCGASAYKKAFYLNPEFELLPTKVKEELRILCVRFTEEVGGILTLEFDEEGELVFKVRQKEGDPSFDEIGSGLLIRKLREEHQEVLAQIALYYQIKKGGSIS